MASKDRGAATAGRVANKERQRIERSEVIQSGQVLAARQVGGEKQTKQVSETAKRAAMRAQEGNFTTTNRHTRFQISFCKEFAKSSTLRSRERNASSEVAVCCCGSCTS